MAYIEQRNADYKFYGSIAGNAALMVMNPKAEEIFNRCFGDNEPEYSDEDYDDATLNKKLADAMLAGLM